MDNGTKSNINKVSLDLRVVVIVLLVVVAAMLAIWKPWSSANASERTITVTGEAKINDEPDEFTFYPTYEFKDANKDTALASLTKKSDEVVKALKDLGVKDNKIKTNSDGYDYNYYFFNEETNEFTYTLRPEVKVNDLKLAQKVQDYLVSTSPTGQISPQTGFSESKKKELESKARDEATKDARKKADQSANNLGFKIVKVKSFKDDENFGGIRPYLMSDSVSGSAESKTTSLEVQPGENEITYSVSVVYYIR